MSTLRFWIFRWLIISSVAMPLVVGASTPNVVLKDQDGKTRNVNEFIGQGKWTVVAVWSSNCPICRREIHHTSFFYDEYKKRDATVLGLSVDSERGRDKALRFISDHGLEYPNLIGDPAVASMLGGGRFVGTPTFLFYSPDGKLAAHRVGPVTVEQLEEMLAKLRGQKPISG